MVMPMHVPRVVAASAHNAKRGANFSECGHAAHRQGGLKPASNWPQAIENHEQSHLKAAS